MKKDQTIEEEVDTAMDEETKEVQVKITDGETLELMGDGEEEISDDPEDA